MFGKSLSQYLSFQKWILTLIVVVAVGRLGMSLAGLPNAQAKWLSVTVALLIGLVYSAVAVHTSGFGSYRQLYGLLLIQSIVGQGLVALGIILGIVTGHDNIFTAPEYSGGGDGKTWFHVGAHVVVGTIVLPLLSWLIGSLILAVTKKVAPQSS